MLGTISWGWGCRGEQHIEWLCFVPHTLVGMTGRVSEVLWIKHNSRMWRDEEEEVVRRYSVWTGWRRPVTWNLNGKEPDEGRGWVLQAEIWNKSRGSEEARASTAQEWKCWSDSSTVVETEGDRRCFWEMDSLQAMRSLTGHSENFKFYSKCHGRAVCRVSSILKSTLFGMWWMDCGELGWWI